MLMRSSFTHYSPLFKKDSTMVIPHVSIAPNILYFGTPVVLIGSSNEDGSFNLAPFSSVFWLGWRCVLGLAAGSQTLHNLLRTGECVLNLPSIREADVVDRLALTTGNSSLSDAKRTKGYVYEADKFARAKLTPIDSETVAAPRVLECPIQLEAVVAARHGIGEDSDALRGFACAVESRIQRVYAHPTLLMDGDTNRIDPDKWHPLIMSFQKFYGLSAQVHPSRLAAIPEHAYRRPDMGVANRPRPMTCPDTRPETASATAPCRLS
jgi:flavin reductase (DIM6/NTAB) family NADH-FMN oxidoreductase RutF